VMRRCVYSIFSLVNDVSISCTLFFPSSCRVFPYLSRSFILLFFDCAFPKFSCSTCFLTAYNGSVHPSWFPIYWVP
jgi:hypothetical protein